MAGGIFKSLLNHTCKVIRRQYDTTEDVWGGSTESFVTIANDVPCRFEQTEELIEFSRRGEKLYTRIRVFMDITVDVKEEDILEKDGVKYRVEVLEDSAGEGHHYELAVVNLE